MPPRDGVRPFDWVQALLGSPTLADTAALRAAFALLRYAPGNAKRQTGWTFFVSEQALADLAQCSPATIRRGMKVLKDAGWVEQVRRGGGVKGHANTFVLRVPPLTGERSDADNLRSPASGEDPGGRHANAGDARANSAQSGDELRSDRRRTPLTGEQPVEKSSVEKSSVEKDSRSPAPRSTVPVALSDDWTPNDQHRAAIERAELDTDDLAQRFRDAMGPERRRDWDRTFGSYIVAAVDGREGDVFVGTGHDLNDERNRQLSALESRMAAGPS